MNDLRLAKVMVFNLPIAGDVVSSGGVITIKGLPPIKTSEWTKDVREVPALAETKKVQTISLTAAPASGTLYQFGLSIDEREHGHTFGTKKFGHKTGIVTGTAATDKHNIYSAWAAKYNRQPRVNSKAYAVVTQTHAAGTFTVGATITGATSGAKGIVISSASGTANIGMITTNVNFVNGESLASSTGPGPFVAAAGPTLGVQFRVLDDGDYYSLEAPYNGGQTHLLPGLNVPKTDIVTVTAAVYQFGTGAIMARMKPVWDNLTNNLIRGRMEFTYATEDFVAGKNYNLIIIGVKKQDDNSSIIHEQAGVRADSETYYGIYADNTAAGYAAYLAALQAL
jgi:hypothetical protein